jgi:hypothetical protein
MAILSPPLDISQTRSRLERNNLSKIITGNRFFSKWRTTPPTSRFRVLDLTSASERGLTGFTTERERIMWRCWKAQTAALARSSIR